MKNTQGLLTICGMLSLVTQNDLHRVSLKIGNLLYGQPNDSGKMELNSPLNSQCSVALDALVQCLHPCNL